MSGGPDDHSASFQELLRIAKSGDADAVERLFARVADESREGRLLLAMARRILPPGDRAREFVESRDLLQSALRSGWLHLDGFRGTTPGEFMNWMRAILRRRLGRVVRRKEVRAGVQKLPETDATEAPGESEEAIARLVREEVRERVREAMQGLPDDQRAVLDLRLQGLNAPQIGVMLCLKPQTVRKRESRAVARLREMLGEPGSLDE